MEIETILNAMEKSISLVSVMGKQGFETVRYRQYRAFRSRILRMVAEKDQIIQYQDIALEVAHQNGVSTIATKDARIAELEGEIDCLRSKP